MIIEFIGPSGSGKTTVAEALINSIKADVQPGRQSLGRKVEGWSRVAAGRLISQSISSLLYMPLLARKIAISDAILYKKWCSIPRKKRHRLLALACRNRLQSQGSGCYLQDQGLIQAIGYLSRDWCDTERKSFLLKMCTALGYECLPQMVISFTCHSNAIGTRTKMNGARHQSPEEISRTMASFSTLAGVLESHGGIQLELVNNHDDFNATVVQTSQIISKFIARTEGDNRH